MKLDGADNLALLALGLIGGVLIVKTFNNTKISLGSPIDAAVQKVASYTVRGLRNNNPFNIKIGPSPWQGKIAPNTDGVFEQFDTPENGIRAGMKILHSYLNQGVNTVESMITRFAPAADNNNTVAYINAVASQMNVNPRQILTDKDIPAMTPAIIMHENGLMPYTVATLDAAFAITGIVVA